MQTWITCAGPSDAEFAADEPAPWLLAAEELCAGAGTEALAAKESRNIVILAKRIPPAESKIIKLREYYIELEQRVWLEVC